MPRDLSVRTVTLAKATAAALEAHGSAATRRMYEQMFQNEAIRDLFNQPHHGETGSQPKALAAPSAAYARSIDGLAAPAPAVERIAQKHEGHHPLRTALPRGPARPGPRRGGSDRRRMAGPEHPHARADRVLRGPRASLRTFVGGLARAGVASGRIHHEFFGPADELLAA